MRITVLDGYTLNPGDLSWEALEALGPCTVYERTPPEQVVGRAGDADVVLTNKALMPREVITQLPNLKFIGVLATGVNVVDLEAARECGIAVANVPAYSTRSVAQMTIALLLELTQHVGHHAQGVREGRWSASKDFCFWDMPLVELDGLTLGLIGCGQIGQEVAGLARAFGMRVLAYTRSGCAGDIAQICELDTLLHESDVVSLHCPLTDENERMINAGRLALMKPTAFLINTSRGGLIDELALADALNGDRLGGAGLDVLSAEPPGPDHPLLTARHCVLTPHMAWATRAARLRLMETVVTNVRAFVDGHPIHVVNKA